MRVMRILTRPNVGGPARQAVALWHAHQQLGVSTLLAVGTCAADEPALDLAAAGIPRCEPERVSLASAGFVVVPGLRAALSPWADLRAQRQLRTLLRAFAPAVVHTHTSKAGWLGRSAARAARVPVSAHTFHGHVLRGYFGRLRSAALARLERRLASRTDLLFAVSDSCADELAELGVAARARLQVVPPAVPRVVGLDRTAARRALGVDPDRWLVAAVGRLVQVKRIDRFVAAVASLPDCHGHVYGDGPLRGALSAAAPPRVQFLGTDPEVRARLAAYDALVVPSDREGCPLVAIEAFAAGVPVVGFDVPGVRDVLGSYGGGVLVPEAAGDAGLAAALVALAADARKRQACVDAGREALGRFAPEHVAAVLLQAYESACAARVGYAGGAGG